MFTVKLFRAGAVVKIVEGAAIDIRPAAGGAREVSVTGHDVVYAVGPGSGQYDAAYIENAAGKTTEVVRAARG